MDRSAGSDTLHGGIFAADGDPFTDIDAARFKAHTLSRELGEAFEPKPLPGGGYVVVHLDPPSSSSHHQEPEASRPWLQSLGGDRSPGGTAATAGTLNFGPSLRAFLPDFFIVAIATVLLVLPHLPLTVFPTGSLTDQLAASLMWVIQMLSLFTTVTMLSRILWIYAANRYHITAENVEAVRGIIARSSQQIQLTHVRSIDVKQTVLQRLLNVGSVRLATGGTDDYEVQLHYLSRPTVLRHKLQQRIQTATARGRTYD